MRKSFPSNKRILLPVFWIPLSLLIAAIDYLSGPFIYFSILFVFPIVLATWFNGRLWGMILACCLPFVRVFLRYPWDAPWSSSEGVINAGIRIMFFIIVVLLVDSEAKRRALQEEIKVLKGLLPICSFCKKIRTKENEWVMLEEYITEHSEAEFSHGFCPQCLKDHYGVTLPPQD